MFEDLKKELEHSALSACVDIFKDYSFKEIRKLPMIVQYAWSVGQKSEDKNN